MSPDAIRDAIVATRFAPYRRELLAALRPGLHASVTPRDTGSWIAGQPRVPAGFEWPWWDARAFFGRERAYAERNSREYGTPFWTERLRELDTLLAGDTRRPLRFAAQLDLASLPRWPDLPPLPPRGTLYLFVDMVHFPGGYYPESRGAWRVLYRPDDRGLSALQPPPWPVEIGAADYGYALSDGVHASAVELTPAWMLPPSPPQAELDAADEDGGDGSEAVEEEYAELLVALGQASRDRDRNYGDHRIFGTARPIQNPMERMCHFASLGIDLLADGAHARDHGALEAGVADWLLLAQIDSDNRVPWMFGDAGSLYFWIRRQDLAAGNFAAVWGEFQCS